MKLYVVQLLIVTKEQVIVSAWAEAVLAPSDHIAVTDVVFRVKEALWKTSNEFDIIPVKVNQVSDAMVVTANAAIQVEAVNRMAMISTHLEAMYGSVCPVCSGAHTYKECPIVHSFMGSKPVIRDNESSDESGDTVGDDSPPTQDVDTFSQLLRDMRNDWTGEGPS